MKVSDNSALLAKIKGMVAKHRKHIKPLQDVDEPAIARPDDKKTSSSHKARRRFKVIDERSNAVSKGKVYGKADKPNDDATEKPKQGKVNAPDQAEFDADGRPVISVKKNKKDGEILIDPDEREMGDTNVAATQESTMDKYRKHIKKANQGTFYNRQGGEFRTADNKAKASNDNPKTHKWGNDKMHPHVTHFMNDRVKKKEGGTVTAQDLYHEFCNHCEKHGRDPMALPTFGREFGKSGVKKAKVSGRVRHIGISLTDK